MDFPREIKLDEKTELRLTSYIDEILMRCYAERGSYVDKVIGWQTDYDATPSEEQGIFPFKGAATLIIPITAITVEAIHARVVTTMFALDQFVTCKPVSAKWQDHSRPVERFLDNELLERIGIKKPINDALLETTKFGTGIVKTGYEKVVKTAVRERNGKDEEFSYVVKSSALVEAISVSRFLMPLYYQNPQNAPWCGEEHEYSPYETRLNEVSGLFKSGTMEKLNAHFSINREKNINSGAEFKEAQEEKEASTPLWPTTIKTVELWMAFDVDGGEESVNAGLIPREEFTNGFDKEIVVHYHPLSHTILSCRYNWHDDLRRPYITGVYFPVEHRWHGLGVCKQTEQFQKEITTQHRQRIDNATLANCRMIKVNKLSDYGPNEPIFPGKIWFVDNMDDVQTMQLGEIYSSSYSNESQALQYVQQRTGINEVNLGMPQVGTPGTATSDLARIQEGNKKFDFTYRNNRDFVNQIVNSTVLNIKQFGTRASVYFEEVDGGDLVKEFLALDYEMIKNNLALKIHVAGQQDNKLLDRQNYTQIIAALKDYVDGMMALGQVVNPAVVQEIAKHGMIAGTEVMKQLLESFDLKNIDRIIIPESLINGSSQASTLGTTGGPQNISPPAGVVSGPGAPPQQPLGRV